MFFFENMKLSLKAIAENIEKSSKREEAAKIAKAKHTERVKDAKQEIRGESDSKTQKLVKFENDTFYLSFKKAGMRDVSGSLYVRLNDSPSFNYSIKCDTTKGLWLTIQSNPGVIVSDLSNLLPIFNACSTQTRLTFSFTSGSHNHPADKFIDLRAVGKSLEGLTSPVEITFHSAELLTMNLFAILKLPKLIKIKVANEWMIGKNGTPEQRAVLKATTQLVTRQQKDAGWQNVNLIDIQQDLIEHDLEHLTVD